MQKYLCTDCRYIYNPYLWDEEQEIEAWVEFYSIDENWTCPICGSPKDLFIEYEQGINIISQEDNLIPQEEAHIPFYKEENNKVIIQVWTEDEPYVQDDVHFVEYIWIYDLDWELLDIIDFPDIENEIEFEIPEDDYIIRMSCSEHWIWQWLKLN